MEPELHQGDLALLKEADSYKIGDVTGFMAADLQQIVLHRIVAKHGDVFTTKGDNNSWLDPYEPTATDFLGRLWLRFPGAGKALLLLQHPVVAAFVSALAVIVAMWGAIFGSNSRALRLRRLRRVV